MKIGLVSDSHGRVELLRRAAVMLAARGARAVVHCGDVGSVACIRALGIGIGGEDSTSCIRALGIGGGGEATVAAYAVSGNMDRHIDRLAAEARRCGVRFHRRVVEVPLGDGRYLAATHGDDERFLSELVAGGQFPYVCHGHTHRIRDERFASVRVICPGALRYPQDPRRPTAAILDTQSDLLEYIAVTA